MFRVLAIWCMVGVAMAVPLEDQKQQTDLQSVARSLSQSVARTLTEDALASPDGGLWQALTKTLLVVAMVWFAYLVVTETFISNRRSFARSLTTGWDYEEGMFNSVLNSIDPVDMSFRWMEIENQACRKRTLCELSSTPVIGQFLQYISSNISSLKDYQEAMSAGEALQDCALLFAECPKNQHFIRK